MVRKILSHEGKVTVNREKVFGEIAQVEDFILLL